MDGYAWLLMSILYSQVSSVLFLHLLTTEDLTEAIECHH